MDSSEPLIVEIAHMYEKDNAKAHHTYNFEAVHLKSPTPVLRRGQEFNIALRFNREYVVAEDIVRLIFSFGDSPNSVRGTRVVKTVSSDDTCLNDLDAWGVRIVGADDMDLSVEVRSSVASAVGVWSLEIETATVGSNQPPNTYKFDRDIYLLFNPWIKEDSVFLEDERLLDEYILNDVGKIWVGERGRSWIFGQFDASILPACMLLLERSGIKSPARGDPIRMTRAISKIVNSNKDRGVVVGRWPRGSPSDEVDAYNDGTSPCAWTSSVPILEQFLKTGNPVKYGQCWVYAGVVTTVCRALGIPSRVVTNLDSAHDGNASLSIDRYYDLDNENYHPKNMGRQDSIWNFHVWNDVWMARPDLPKGYGGWQAIDATPQETSDGDYQCGPASVEAIKQGAAGYNHDVAFILAAVNADVICWKKDPESDFGFSRISCDRNQIGRMILTKAPWIFDPNGEEDREDVTLTYKAQEGTEDERLTLYRAVRSTETAKRYYSIPDPTKEDVKFDLVDLERVNIGEPFTITVNITNKSAQPRHIETILSAASVYYTGVKGNLVKKDLSEFVIQPNADEQLQLTITVDDYMDKLVEHSMMKLCALATVRETRQTWAAEDDFQIVKPSIKVTIEGEPVVGEPSAITLSFVNPLKTTLTECKFNYAGPGFSKNKTLPFGDVGPEDEIRVEHQLVPQKAGPQIIIATFTSKELTDITGSASVNVHRGEEE